MPVPGNAVVQPNAYMLVHIREAVAGGAAAALTSLEGTPAYNEF